MLTCMGVEGREGMLDSSQGLLDVPMAPIEESVRSDQTFLPVIPQSETMEKGWPPKLVPVHGPAFLKLDPQQQSDLRRLHHNLGHPDPARLHRLLVSQGAEHDVAAGALDMQCDVCLETQPKPKLANPGNYSWGHGF